MAFASALPASSSAGVELIDHPIDSVHQKLVPAYFEEPRPLSYDGDCSCARALEVPQNLEGGGARSLPRPDIAAAVLKGCFPLTPLMLRGFRQSACESLIRITSIGIITRWLFDSRHVRNLKRQSVTEWITLLHVK